MFSFLTEYKTAQKIISKHYQIIFYAESRYYFQYFEHLYETFANEGSYKICYLTSDKHDPILKDKRIESYYLKNMLAGIFPRLRADVMIMTMPDLQNFIYKKSSTVNKYIYVFHALVSTHQQYRAHAFDNYDAIFCTGPQQVQEIRGGEGIYSLKAKELINYGYPLLESLKRKADTNKIHPDKILIAPSWYKEGILNTCILPLVEVLSETEHQIWIRPHPEFIKRNKKQYEQLLNLTRKSNKIFFDTSPSVFAQLADAGDLITDRSGIAFEYAFSTGRPVLFIDTALKIQNAEIKKFTSEPVENSYRSRVGKAINTNEVSQAATVLLELKTGRESWQTSIKKAEEEIVFPISYRENGIQYIRQQLML